MVLQIIMTYSLRRALIFQADHPILVSTLLFTKKENELLELQKCSEGLEDSLLNMPHSTPQAAAKLLASQLIIDQLHPGCPHEINREILVEHLTSLEVEELNRESEYSKEASTKRYQDSSTNSNHGVFEAEVRFQVLFHSGVGETWGLDDCFYIAKL